MQEINTRPKILPPTGMLVALLLMLALHFGFPVWQNLPIVIRLVGFLPLGLGVYLSYAAERAFHQAGTTVQPFDKSSVLVTDGLFRLSRNPMYLGMVLVLLGVALLLGSLAPFGIIPIFSGWINMQFIRPEESMLASQFGQDWLEYKKRVRRWI
jgi:protein-S-isoprenylcysteine O-methyltransferase Ste14